MSHPDLWEWAIATYAREGVADACLDLQDNHGQSVLLLLWTAWLATQGLKASDDTLEEARDLARAWDETTLIPLRRLRDTLKLSHPNIDAGARLDIRQKTIELERKAEHHVIQALEHLPGDAAPGVDTLEALVRLARVWSSKVPRNQLQTLAARLSA